MVSTLAVVTAVAGTVTLALTGVVARRHRSDPGGQWFLSMAAIMAFSSLLYAVALTVRDPFVRHLLEAVFTTAALYVGLLWTAFALEYTGRGRLLRGPLAPVGILVGAVGGAVILTDPLHGFVFADFAVTTTLDAATVAFTPGPGLLVLLVIAGLLTGVGWLLLLDTVLDAGSLFGRQTAALVVTPLFPIVAAVLFAFDLSPVTGFNIVAVSFAPHAALDLYALYGGDLFEFDPATRRVGTRAALASVGVPIVTVDTDGRIIALDDADGTLFDRPERELVGGSLNERLSTPVDPTGEPEVVDLQTADGLRQFRVRTVPFADGDRRLGYTVIFQDVTDVIARERRLSVLNRVLRHNLRNDLNVVVGHAGLLEDHVDEDGQRSVETILRRGERLLSVGERARELDRVADGADRRDRVSLASVMASVEQSVDHPDARIDNQLPSELELETDAEVCQIVLENIVANGVEHADTDSPVVTVRLVDAPEQAAVDNDQPAFATVQVTDNGPGIPDQEIEVLDTDAESALEHGSGLGLWVINSGVAALGGDVSFEGSSDGTTVTLRLPGVVTTVESVPATDTKLGRGRSGD